MSQIPSGLSRLKTPSRIVKPVQGGSVGAGSQPSAPSVKPRGSVGNSSQAGSSTVQPRTSPSGAKLNQMSSGVTRRGMQTSSNGKLSASRDRLVSPRGSLTGVEVAQPRLPSREKSQTRLQYRRESSSSSLRGASSRAEGAPVIRRRGEVSRAPSESQNQTVAVDSSKSNLLSLFKLGDRVLVGNSNPGAIAFIGQTKFAKGDWAGVVLDECVGKNNGSVQGVRYFECDPGHGIFTKLEKLTKINQIGGGRTSLSDGKAEKEKANLEIGYRVVVSGTKHGVVRYLGETGFAKGEWAGIELDEPLGKNDGAVAGTRYFQCEPNFGLFAPLHKVAKSSLPLPPRLQAQLPQGNDVQNSLGALGSNSSINSVSSTLSEASSTPKLSALNTSQIISSPEPEVSEVKSSPPPPPPPPPSGSTQTPVSSGLVTSQLVALQEALEDREKQIQSLLAEREFERAEVANATSQVTKVEEEVGKLKEQHNEAILEKEKSISELQSLLETANKEKDDLQSQLEEEKRRVEDLQFKLEEEEITLGDELKIEQKEIETLEIELKEKVASLSRLKKELETTQNEKGTALSKITELESALSESNTVVLDLRTSVSDSNSKIRELEATLFAKQAEHSGDANLRELQLKENSEKISSLAKELEGHTKTKTGLESEIKILKSELVKSREESEALQKEIYDLTEKLHNKEDEFSSLCSELQVIKVTTLELQKQLHLSEVKSENLAADKAKLESQIAELAKNSGDSSEKLVYLNEQLREKDRTLDNLKSTSAEAQVQIGRLTEDLAQAKEKHDKDMLELKKSHHDQTQATDKIVQNLKSELEESLKNREDMKSAHQAKLQDLTQTKDTERSAVEEEIKQKIGEINLLTQELHKLKTLQQETLKENTELSGLKEQFSKLQSEYKASQDQLTTLQLQLESLKAEKGLVVGAQEDAEKKQQELTEQYSALQQEHQSLVQSFDTVSKENSSRKEEVEALSKARDITEKEKCDMETKLEELKTHCDSLQKEVEDARSLANSKEEQLHLLSSSSSDAEAVILKLRSQVEDARTQRDQVTKDVNILSQENQSLKQSVNALEKDKADVAVEKDKLQAAIMDASNKIDGMSVELEEANKRENYAKNAADAVRKELEIKLQNAELLAKKREEEVNSYRKENEMLKSRLEKSFSNPTSTQSVNASDMEAVMSKLRETEDLLEAVQTEKGNSEAQVDFLNSVIVDLQRKNEEAEKKIELFMMGNVPDTNGTLNLSDDDEPARPGIRQRLFCDICDVFDQHDTDDCPLQSSDAPDNLGTQYHGNRNEDRPYCDICEVFGHWTQDCDDEETF
ncbi:CAP-Gly domain-containing linker protein 1-like isoform X2 [Stylophora pistillata]|uniref:CAP-Gly domain-containing linker protein 2 n=1 Tax=Stylophora pistillata TaxID=50429 RepID=A0A2B4S4E8_STYPI|nr:CAP-Gly domain-containing linker protein 1-like isoform X2 [Stylophora pistillata]PFX23382.1 CAP-Gly domain-containing linker protein 2 [Stylophora pistillata]